MNYDGKTYRNLEGQVKYLTEVAEALDNRITEVAANIPSKMIVEELPEEGDPNITYYVGPKGTEPNLYYEVWVWVQEEPDGPFVWRELEDTDQVDLSGYLEKNTTTTTEDQAYIKNADGTQGMMNITLGASGYTVARRYSDGTLAVGYATADNRATNKGYCDDNYVAKVKTAGEYLRRVYGVKQTGDVITQELFNMSTGAYGEALAQRDSSGQITLPNQSGYTPGTDQAISKRYADNHYLAKQGGTSTYVQAYAKATDGTQGMVSMTYQVVGGAIVQRNAAGAVLVPLDPFDQYSAVSKKYVDDTVGQLLYLHDLELIITVDATNKLYVKAYLVNGSATAITSFDRIVYKRIDVQWGAFGPNISNSEAVAVTKLPDGFRQDEFEDPLVGFLYQYIDNGYLTSGKTNSSMSTTITDTVISW